MSYKLLLADDSITIRKVVGIIFANEDYALAVVDNGNAALEKAREIMPDIIMADVVMPEKTGYEVCTEVRNDPSLKHIPLLLLTGAFEPFDEDKARQCGADDFISKPFESQQLIDKVKNLIALGKERKTGAVVPEPVEAVAPQVAQEQIVAPTLAEPVVGAMGGVFLQAEEVVEKQPVTPSPAEEISLPAEELSFAPEELSLPAEELSFTPEEPSLPAAEISLPADDLSVTEEAVEALPEDDLWDVFAIEEENEEETAETGSILEDEVATPVAGFETEEEFSFSTDEETPSLDAGVETPAAVIPETDSFEIGGEVDIAGEPLSLDAQLRDEAFDSAEEASEEISFVSGLDEAPPAPTPALPEVVFDFVLEEEAAPAPTPADLTPAAGTFEFAAEADAQTAFISGQEELPPVAAPAAPEIDLQFAPEEEYVPAAPLPPVLPPVEPLAAPVQQAAPAAPVAQTPAVSGQPVPGVAALSEEQLAASLANVSREVIERIVWEVVPDLAETLIREEIRKLKEGLRK